RFVTRNRFGELPPNVERDRRDEDAQGEWHAPPPGVQLFVRERRCEYDADETAHDDRELLAVRLPRGHRGAFSGRSRFEEIRRCRPDFPTAREALNQPRNEED